MTRWPSTSADLAGEEVRLRRALTSFAAPAGQPSLAGLPAEANAVSGKR